MLVPLLLLSVPAHGYGIVWADNWPHWPWSESWGTAITNFSWDLPTESGAWVYTSQLRHEKLWLEWGMNGTERTSCGALVTDLWLRTAQNRPMCLDSGLEPKEGTLLKVWECLGKVPQQTWVWTLTDTTADPNSSISLYGSDLCVSMKRDIGPAMQLFKCNESDVNQRWKVRGGGNPQ